MRVTLVIYSMAAGGAERTMAIMASYWVERGWDVTLLTVSNGPVFYKLDRRINHRPLGADNVSANVWQRLTGNFRRIFGLRRAIRESRPDVVVSMLSETNVCVVAACAGLGIPVVVQEQIDPAQHPIGKGWNLLRRLIYPFATKVVVLNQRSLEFFGRRIRKKACIVPNPALNTGVRRPPGDPKAIGGTIVAIGRLVQQKGFDMLLHAFAPIYKKHRNWRLVILGEGPLRTELECLAMALGASEAVSMPGNVRDPFAVLSKSDIFVMSSRYEGFPLSLCEAMGCGVPAVSFDCPSGPGEIIRNGYDGLLVKAGDVVGLQKALERMVEDGELRERTAQNAPEVLERFGVVKVMEQWEEVLQQAVADSGRKPGKDVAEEAGVLVE